MKYLLIDDMPEYLKNNVRILRTAGHTVETARDLDTAWASIERETDNPFDLLLIDLGLDKKAREFASEDEEMRDALRSRGHGDLPMSGQALGLRLWRRRKEIKQRYCYITNFSASEVWLANFDKEDPEFGGKTVEEVSSLILDKSALWPDNIGKKIETAYQVWEDRQWIG